MDRFCSQCGTPRTAGFAFCPKCGRRFEDSAADAPASTILEANDEPDNPETGEVRPASGAGPGVEPPAMTPPAAAHVPDAGPAPGGEQGSVQPASRPVWLRVLMVVAGLAMVGLGAFQIYSALAPGESDRPRSRIELSQPNRPLRPAGDWIVGQWSPTDVLPCAQWIRFNADRTLIDSQNNSGTWSITPDASGNGESLTLILNGQVSGPGRVFREANGWTVQGEGGTISWIAVTC